jgi:hypothetical protein
MVIRNFKEEGMNRATRVKSRFCSLLLGSFVFFLFLPHSGAALPPGDDFIRGYATAILQRDFQITAQSLEVKNGIIYIEGLKTSDEEGRKIKNALAAIEGVKQVVIIEGGKHAVMHQEPQIGPELPAFLPPDHLFKSLLADPRWPHFSASYQAYLHNQQLSDVGSATFGETISFYRFAGPWRSTMEVGIQAGVFAIFDLGASSMDLVNADYFVAFPLTFKKNDFTTLTRVFHQSSHLGDEFLLRGRAPERVNLSYEGVDTILSYMLPLGFRIYGGGGYLFDRDPSDLKPWITEAGLEFRSPWTLLGGAVRPVSAVDIQSREESGWNADVSARAGVQFENPNFLSRRLLLLIEYYNGRSPNGQFYIRNIESIGLGLHFFYD